MSEAREDRIPIGTTSRGIGPCYEDKIGAPRHPHRGSVRTATAFCALYTALAEDKQLLAQTFNIQETIDYEEIRDQYLRFAERIRPMVCDTAQLAERCHAGGQARAVRGRAGHHAGRRSRHLSVRDVLQRHRRRRLHRRGRAAHAIHGVIGVSKAYITRVGSGPFPTEVLGRRWARESAKRGNEFGAVTGRPRRCGWFDVPLLRYTAMINGFTSLVITKLDVLDQFDEIPVCTEYQERQDHARDFSGTGSGGAGVRDAAGLEIRDARADSSSEDLPGRARDYLKFLSERTGVEIGCISTGPERDETILIEESRLAQVI